METLFHRLNNNSRSQFVCDHVVCVCVCVCGAQERNIFNRIFGGFLMRKAYELGWANACSFGWVSLIITLVKLWKLTRHCSKLAGLLLQRVSAQPGGRGRHPLPEAGGDRLPAAAVLTGWNRCHLVWLCPYMWQQGSNVTMTIVITTTSTFVAAFLVTPVEWCRVVITDDVDDVYIVCRCATHRANTFRSEFTARCLTRWPASTTLPMSSTSRLSRTGTSPTSCPTRMEVSARTHTHTHTETHGDIFSVKCCLCWLFLSYRVHVVLGWKETLMSHCWTVKDNMPKTLIFGQKDCIWWLARWYMSGCETMLWVKEEQVSIKQYI